MRDVQQWMKSVEDRLHRLDRRIKSSGPRLPDTGWINMPLANGWANYGGAFQIAQYGRFDGEVKFRGLIQGASRTSAIFFNAPAGFRHSGGDQLWSCNSDTTITRIDTRGPTGSPGTAGDMFLQTGGVAYVSLSQISYPAEA
jgi:hypothetical protein